MFIPRLATYWCIYMVSVFIDDDEWRKEENGVYAAVCDDEGDKREKD